MASKVFWMAVKHGEARDITQKKVGLLFHRTDLGVCIGKNDLVAIKMHFGEKENDTHIPSVLVRPVVDEIKRQNGKPFLTDTCVLYRSQRDNAVNHLMLSYDHGFTMDKIGAPVIIADGLVGNSEKEVEIPGKIFSKVSIAAIALEANAVIVLSHVTGHITTGIGGAIKNIGMGFASRKGKLRQHSVMKPAVKKKYCTGCGLCIPWCPADAIAMEEDAARIDSKLCIGCGECLTVCRFDAIQYDWNVDSRDLQKRIAEHALGVTIGRTNKIGYMNFLLSMTKDCDCWVKKQKPVLPDIGILASKDPVAIDAASLNLIQERTGRKLTDVSYPHVDPWVQLRHGEAIGLGSQEYELVELT